jgi:hypothetical protein
MTTYNPVQSLVQAHNRITKLEAELVQVQQQRDKLADILDRAWGFACMSPVDKRLDNEVRRILKEVLHK